MAYTIYEYDTVAMTGEPVQPPSVRTASQASGAAFQLANGTRYVAIVAGADMYLRISDDGATATTADHFISAGETKGFPVRRLDRPYVYGLDA
jgi:hypothetical protein